MDRDIARRCCVTNTFVSNLPASLVTVTSEKTPAAGTTEVSTAAASAATERTYTAQRGTSEGAAAKPKKPVAPTAQEVPARSRSSRPARPSAPPKRIVFLSGHRLQIRNVRASLSNPFRRAARSHHSYPRAFRPAPKAPCARIRICSSVGFCIFALTHSLLPFNSWCAAVVPKDELARLPGKRPRCQVSRCEQRDRQRRQRLEVSSGRRWRCTAVSKALSCYHQRSHDWALNRIASFERLRPVWDLWEFGTATTRHTDKIVPGKEPHVSPTAFAAIKRSTSDARSTG